MVAEIILHYDDLHNLGVCNLVSTLHDRAMAAVRERIYVYS